MNIFARGVLTLALLAVAAFCVFGFMATFEPRGELGLRTIYASVGLLFLAGAFWTAIGRKTRDTERSLP